MFTALVSVDKYLRRSCPDGDSEYVDGEIVERNAGEVDHASLQLRIFLYIATHCRNILGRRGVQGTSASHAISGSRCHARARARPAGKIVTTPPHLVVEVLSRDDRPGAMQEKIGDRLASGISYVWVVNPRTGRAYVHTAEAAREANDGILRTADPAIELPRNEPPGK